MRAKVDKTARHKLNSHVFMWIGMAAAFAGLITQSLTICIITAVVLAGAMVHSGSLRL